MTGPVVVVGGGVMGSAAAWQLAGRGVPVVLLEQFEPGHDRGASHGTSRIFRLTYEEDHYVALGVRALELWRRLEAESGLDILNQTGAVDHGAESMTLALAASLQRAGRSVEYLDPQEAATRWPMMRFDSRVLFHPDGGRVNADQAIVGFQQAAQAHGAVIRHSTPVADIQSDGDSVTVTTRAGEAINARSVVVAAGAWTDRLLVSMGLPPLRVTQEQPVHFPSRVSIADWPSFLHYPEDATVMYGLGSVDGVKLGFHGTGPVIDPDNRNREVDQATLEGLKDYARRWLPGADSALAQPTTCTYTLTPDEHFIVDRVGLVTVLAGFSGHGFKFASAIGELAAQLTLDEAARPPWFAIDR